MGSPLVILSGTRDLGDVEGSVSIRHTSPPPHVMLEQVPPLPLVEWNHSGHQSECLE